MKVSGCRGTGTISAGREQRHACKLPRDHVIIVILTTRGDHCLVFAAQDQWGRLHVSSLLTHETTAIVV